MVCLLNVQLSHDLEPSWYVLFSFKQIIGFVILSYVLDKQIVLTLFGFSGAFYVYGGVCVLAIIFIAKLVPETKGKTLEEIQAMMM